MADLVYHGERNHVIDHLTAHDWEVSAQRREKRTQPTASSSHDEWTAFFRT